MNDPDALVKQVSIKLKVVDLKVFAHHITKSFRPPEGLNGTIVGRKHTVSVYAEVLTDRIQTVLVEDIHGGHLSSKKYPHITIATVNGTPPSESDIAVEDAIKNSTLRELEHPFTIQVTEGYFDGDQVHTSPV